MTTTAARNPAPTTNTTSTPTPAPSTLTSDAKSLDTLRRSLLALTHTLQALHRDLAAPPTAAAPLPPWSSLQNSFNLLTHNLTMLSSHIDASRDLLAAAHPYPLPSFPGREHEALLAQLLLRKKGEGADGAAAAAAEAVGAAAEAWLAELWEWALPWAGEAAAGVPLGIDVSVAERAAEGGAEAVREREGLNRVLKVRSDVEIEAEREKEDGEGEAEGDGSTGQDRMDVDKQPVVEAAKPAEVPMVPLEKMLKFMTTGSCGDMR